jgi:hypothetical protein
VISLSVSADLGRVCLCLASTGGHNNTGDTTMRAASKLVAFSSVGTFDVRLSLDDASTMMNNETEVQVIVAVRDQLQCVTEYNLSSVWLRVDASAMSKFLLDPEHDPDVQRMLSSGSQNVIGQVVSSLSSYLNRLGETNVEAAAQSESCERSKTHGDDDDECGCRRCSIGCDLGVVIVGCE